MHFILIIILKFVRYGAYIILSRDVYYFDMSKFIKLDCSFITWYPAVQLMDIYNCIVFLVLAFCILHKIV